jgi:A/G-specific adenine glycosylase
LSELGSQLYQIWAGEKTRKFRRLLLSWYRRHRRELPWRADPTPYRVWVAEVMLQQTQVRTVLPYYERFLARFPDVDTLAAAPEEEVLALWAGLGYYSRARNLHRAARLIVREFRREVPRRLADIRSLPGVGRYTAGAICSIAFNEPVPVVDGNVKRVIGRLHAVESDVGEAFFWRQSGALVPRTRASDFNQAMMELGALVCVPSRPLCPACPVSSLCDGRGRGIERRVPGGRPVKPAKDVELVILVLQQAGRILLTDKNAVGFIPGLLSLPTCLLAKGTSPGWAALCCARDLLGKVVRLQERGAVRHGITYRRIRAHIFYAELKRPDIRIDDSRKLVWTEVEGIDKCLTSSLYRKALRLTFESRP